MRRQLAVVEMLICFVLSGPFAVKQVDCQTQDGIERIAAIDSVEVNATHARTVRSMNEGGHQGLPAQTRRGTMRSTFLTGEPDGELEGFTYEVIHMPAFAVIGFTEPRDERNEELFGLLMETGRMDSLEEMNPVDKRLYRISSWDKECSKNGYRITIGVLRNENLTIAGQYASELYTVHMRESDYIMFDLWGDDPVRNYDRLLAANYYRLIDEIGLKLNPKVGLTIDVFQYALDGQYMETWIPVVAK